MKQLFNSYSYEFYTLNVKCTVSGAAIKYINYSSRASIVLRHCAVQFGPFQ